MQTGHHPSCVCGSCSRLRQECQWPDSERWGHNWLPVLGNLLECPHCGKQAYFKIENVEGEIMTVRLSDSGA